MKTNLPIPPRPVTPEHHGRHVGRAVVAMPTPESIEAARRWQFERFMAQRDVIARASRRARHHRQGLFRRMHQQTDAIEFPIPVHHPGAA